MPGLGFSLQAGSTINFNPADATTYYVGCFPGIAPTTTAARVRCYVPFSGSVAAVYLTFWNAGTLSSAQASTVQIRVNNSADTLISAAVRHNQIVTTYNRSDLSIPVSAGDYFEIMWRTPIWTLNPTNVRLSTVIYIR